MKSSQHDHDSPFRPRKVRRAPVLRRRGFRPRLEGLEGRTVPSTLTVTNALDSVAGSLRAAIKAAASGDKIVFDAGLNGQTITLTSGELGISKSLHIEGPGASLLAISGNHAGRIFNVSQNQKTVVVTIAGLTIEDGLAWGTDGGGILNVSSTLTLTDDVLSNNVSRGGVAFASDGGGISNHNGGSLTVNGCTFSGNQAIGGDGGGTAFGGAIANGWDNSSAASTATVIGCLFSGNRAQGGNGGVVSSGDPFLGVTEGGAIVSSGKGGTEALTVINSTFVSNQSIAGSGASGGKGAPIYEEGVAKGGAIANVDGPSLAVSGCTFSYNLAIGGSDNVSGAGGGDRIGHAIGGAVMTEGSVTATITNCTFDHNQARGGDNNTGTGGDFLLGRGGGGAIGTLVFDAPTNLTVSDSIFTDNSAVGGGGNSGSNPFTGDGVGGGLMNERGAVTSVTGSTFTGNRAVGGGGTAGHHGGDGLGGAVANILGATLTVSARTMSSNQAVGGTGGSGGNGGNGFGGGIFNDGLSVAPANAGTPATLTVLGSTITGNQAIGGAAGVGGTDGLGEGGGLFLADRGIACLDATTVVKKNHASTSDDDISGVFTTCP